MKVLFLLVIIVAFAESLNMTEEQFKKKKFSIRKSKLNNWFGIQVVVKDMSHFISIECENEKSCDLTELEDTSKLYSNFTESQYWIDQLRRKNITSLKIFETFVTYPSAWNTFLFVFKQFR
jgi:hypothetical protein